MHGSLRKVIVAGAAYLVALLFLAPYIEMFVTALKPKSEIWAIPALYLPTRFDWNNFVAVWDVAPIATFLQNSLLIAGFATLIVLAVSLPAAYYMARNRFRGRGLFLVLVLVTQMLAPTALVIGIYREVVIVGLVDNLLALVFVDAGFNLAFSIWILNAYFQTIPEEIEEAARLDGCSTFQSLRFVTIPLALPGIVTAVIFTFIAAWNEFVIALTLLQSTETKPITVGITGFIGQYQVEWQFLFAASLIAVVPVVILFAGIERWLAGGLTAGSVK